ncbi:MAG: hypothetical protein Q7J09_04770 [Methanocalculus sp.]|uniref:hypothetical protein n=1 Tax=Methanocalculus sp. TaxID=2004547 RepID=UPI002718E933|nr:hypothetical protein [Methanocalculus sp.]MDO9539298.1 hypothetical protein [Methanocalculus sp.]
MGSEFVERIIAALVLAALISSPFSAQEAEGRGCMGGKYGRGNCPFSTKPS